MYSKIIWILLLQLFQGCATYYEDSKVPPRCLFARIISKPFVYFCNCPDHCVVVETDKMYMQPHLASLTWCLHCEALMRMFLFKISNRQCFRPNWESGSVDQIKCLCSGKERLRYQVVKDDAKVKCGNEHFSETDRVIYSGKNSSINARVIVTKNDSGMVNIYLENNGNIDFIGCKNTDLANVKYTCFDNG